MRYRKHGELSVQIIYYDRLVCGFQIKGKERISKLFKFAPYIALHRFGSRLFHTHTLALVPEGYGSSVPAAGAVHVHKVGFELESMTCSMVQRH